MSRVSSLLGVYVKPTPIMVRGQGCYLFDSNDKKYLDFTSGIAVTALGHNDDGIVQTISNQSRKLIHLSNLYHNEHGEELATQLVSSLPGRLSNAKVFYCNSGTEANEGAFKFARKFALFNGKERSTIISFSNAFHGRTMGSLSATPNQKYQKPFLPLVPGFKTVEFNDINALSAIDNTTAAVIVEPIQGEGGIHPIDQSVFEAIRDACDSTGALLIADEIQCGLGRTGKLFAFENYGVVPDIITLAKPIANGFPMGAVILSESVSKSLNPGEHGTTFGGSPLATAIAKHVLSRISKPAFLEHVTRMGEYIKMEGDKLAKEFPVIKDVRGVGLLMGLELNNTLLNSDLVDACREKGLLLVGASGNTIRLIPALVVTKKEIDEAFSILRLVLSTMNK